MNSKIPLGVTTILVVIVAFFLLRQSPAPSSSLCGNGICDSIERANPSLCPQDCKPNQNSTPASSQGKCGDGVCDPIEKAHPDACPDDCHNYGHTLIQNLSYGSESSSQKLDLYLPKNSTGKIPLIIEIHGGGFVSGDKYPSPHAYFLVPNGYAVAALNYRLAKEAIFPAGVEDVKSAVRWLRANADKYNFDINNFGVIGGSAGGYYSSILGVTGGVRDFDVGTNLGYSSSVRAAVDEYGISNFSSLASETNNSRAGWLGCSDVFSASCVNAAKASPVTYIDSNDSPFLILHGENDDQIPIEQSKEFYAALQKAGVPSDLILVPNAGHGGPEFYNYNTQIVDFFNKYLK